MKKALVLWIVISMVCVSIPGAAFSLNKGTNSTDSNMIRGLATESPEVNKEFLSSINQNVEKYMNFDNLNTITPVTNELTEIEFPWTDRPLPTGAGDFVDWVINVNYKGNYFQEEIEISPLDFIRRFIDNPWYFEECRFDVDEDGEEDLRVLYSIFTSQITNYQEGIDCLSLRSVLRIDTSEVMDRTALLEVWSEISFNFGLIQKGKSKDVSQTYTSKTTYPFLRTLQRLKSRFERFHFPVLNDIINLIMNKFKEFRGEKINEPPVFPAAASDDKITIGTGVSSAEGDRIPINFEKRFNIARKNIIFGPTIFEHELCQPSSKEPLGLIFGFQTFAGGTNQPIFDAAFNVEFDPAIYIRTQFIPRDGYVFYNYDSGSANNKETRVTFNARINRGVGENVELSLIFDKTDAIAQSNNWMSFDLNPLGFVYEANKKFNIGVLLSSPIFSAKAKLVGIPDFIDFYFDADLEIELFQDEYFMADAEASLNLVMSSDLDDIILYYPNLNSDEPDSEFVKISGIPKSQKFYANSFLEIDNGTMLSIRGEGALGHDMSNSLDSIKLFYYSPSPKEPALLLDIPDGLPADNEVGGRFRLYIDADNFYNENNYVNARVYREASGGIAEISLYLPTDSEEPIASVTEIPSDASIGGNLEWNQLEGLGNAARDDAAYVDPIVLNIDVGTFNFYNNLSIGNGETTIAGKLKESGYIHFDSQNEMIGEQIIITDTSTGNQFQIYVKKVIARELDIDWELDLEKSPIPIEELTIEGDLNILQDFYVSAIYEGRNLDFEGDWNIGESGKFSLDFNQDEPIEIVIDDLLKNNTDWDISGGVIISQDFHFDIKWNWIKGTPQDPGYFKINEDTNDPNFNQIFLNITYKPEGESKPQYGIEVGGEDILVIVWVEWWYNGNPIIPTVQWWVEIAGDFYLDLLWKGIWHENVHTW